MRTQGQPAILSPSKLGLPRDLTPAGMAVLTYVAGQRLRFWQHIPRSEIIGGVGLPTPLANAGLIECVERGWLDACLNAHDTVYTLVVDKRRVAVPARH